MIRYNLAREGQLLEARSQATAERCRFRNFVGISLGGGRGKSTAIAKIVEENLVVSLVEARVRSNHRGGGKMEVASDGDGEPFHDARLLEVLAEQNSESTVVAVDAPLTLPACITCPRACPGVDACGVEEVVWIRNHLSTLGVQRSRRDHKKPSFTPYTQRAIDIVIEKLLGIPYEALGQSGGALIARARYLQQALASSFRRGDNLLEVVPRLTLQRLYGATLAQSARIGGLESRWEARKTLLARMMQDSKLDCVWPESVARSPHVFDAVVAAFSARLWAREGWLGPREWSETVKESALARAADRLVIGLDDELSWLAVPPRNYRRA